MAPATTYRTVGDVRYELTRKRVKNLNLHVKPPDGRVIVSAPHRIDVSTIDAFVSSRQRWIKRVQAEIASSPQAKAERATPEEQREWLDVVRRVTPMLIAKWEPRLGVKAAKVDYRNMKSRWGSCKPSTGRICINTRLCLYPPACIEYVVVHELCHLRVPGHGPDFHALMDEVLPDWRETKRLLG